MHGANWVRRQPCDSRSSLLCLSTVHVYDTVMQLCVRLTKPKLLLSVSHKKNTLGRQKLTATYTNKIDLFCYNVNVELNGCELSCDNLMMSVD